MLGKLFKKLGMQGEQHAVDPVDADSLQVPAALGDIRFADYIDRVEGIPRPRWYDFFGDVLDRIGKDAEDDWYEITEYAAQHWVCEIRDAYGGDYQVWHSDNFLLLDYDTPNVANANLQHYEGYLHKIQAALPDIAVDDGYGPHVILRFYDAAAFNRYAVALGDTGGGTASGMCMDEGYRHILVSHSPFQRDRVLVHELTHSLTGIADLPVWLTEGFAVTMEQSICGGSAYMTSREQALKHLELWTPETIQEFWAGSGFRSDGDLQTICYELAYRLMRHIAAECQGDRQRLVEFTRQAKPEDAGQAAAIAVLGKPLEAYIAIWQDPDQDWAPYPDRMAALLDAEKAESKAE